MRSKRRSLLMASLSGPTECDSDRPELLDKNALQGRTPVTGSLEDGVREVAPLV